MILDVFSTLHWFLAFVGRQPVISMLVVCSIVFELIVIVIGNLRVIEIDDPLQYTNLLVLVHQYPCSISALAVHFPHHIELLLLLAVVPSELVQSFSVLLSLWRMLRAIFH